MLINSTHGFEEPGLGEFAGGFHRDRLEKAARAAFAFVRDEREALTHA